MKKYNNTNYVCFDGLSKAGIKKLYVLNNDSSNPTPIIVINKDGKEYQYSYENFSQLMDDEDYYQFFNILPKIELIIYGKTLNTIMLQTAKIVKALISNGYDVDVLTINKVQAILQGNYNPSENDTLYKIVMENKI
jgi:hypothetical protein